MSHFTFIAKATFKYCHITAFLCILILHLIQQRDLLLALLPRLSHKFELDPGLN